MAERPHTRLIIITVATVSCVLALFAVLHIANRGVVFEGCTATATFGWLIPLLSGALVAVIAWMLMDGDRDDLSASAKDDPKATVCMHCGSGILQEWKLCPYCGQLRECDMRIDPHAGRRSVENSPKQA